ATVATVSTVSADFCDKGSENILGNFYCQAVKSIKYSGVGTSGSYPDVVGMDSSGNCEKNDKAFSGPLAPFDEELAAVFRGPLTLKNFAVYLPGGAKTKRDAVDTAAAHHRGHQRFHKRNAARAAAEEAAEKRAVGDVVVATIDGQAVSWINEYDGGAAAAPTPAPAAPAADANVAPAGTKVPTLSKVPQVKKPYTPSSGGDFERVAYFNMDDGQSEGITFLNNMGGQGSGVFDTVFGNSLSYANSDATGGSSDSQTLTKALKSNQEVVLMSDKECNGDCGFVREGTVAYHGWGGASKIFVAEFDMPDDGSSGFNMNMPAYWHLNAKISRTAQYNGCSCWPKCGEFDVAEVLDSGNNRCKSTLHGFKSGGNSDYFERPTSGAVTYVVVYDDDNITIKEVSDFSYPGSLSSSEVGKYCEESDETSVFNL
ncbi:hypothetical protein P152DRAFT_366171, partial [Eremomyces bilateralis CBS 781.70]